LHILQYNIMIYRIQGKIGKKGPKDNPPINYRPGLHSAIVEATLTI